MILKSLPELRIERQGLAQLPSEGPCPQVLSGCCQLHAQLFSAAHDGEMSLSSVERLSLPSSASLESTESRARAMCM